MLPPIMPEPHRTTPRRTVLASLAAAALALSACGGDGPSSGPDDGATSFRIVLIADTHLIGPQYECCSESEGTDNASIVRTVERLARARDRINAISPRPDLVLVLGDVVHDAVIWDEVARYDATTNAFSIGEELFAGFEMPVHIVAGNHDYDVDCDGDGGWPRPLTDQLFARFLGQPPYQAIVHKGWKLILANSQLGPTWEAGHPACATGVGSYGAEQLDWIDAELAEGLPTIIGFHHPFVVTRFDEQPGALNADLPTVLARHPNLVHSFAGHTHRWLRFSWVFPEVGHTVIPATRYDEDNFVLLELDRASPSFRIVDEGKAKWFSTCSHTWRYDGDPGPAPDDTETGDCTILP